MTQIEVLDADITTLEVDAIANAANISMTLEGSWTGLGEKPGGRLVRWGSWGRGLW